MHTLYEAQTVDTRCFNRTEPTVPMWSCWKDVCVKDHIGKPGEPGFGCKQKSYPILEPIEDEE